MRTPDILPPGEPIPSAAPFKLLKHALGFILTLAFLLSLPASYATHCSNIFSAAKASPGGELKRTSPPPAAIGARLQEPSPALTRWLSSWRLKNEPGRDNDPGKNFPYAIGTSSSSYGACLFANDHRAGVSALASSQLYLLNRNLRL